MANLFYHSMYLSCFTVTYLFNVNSNKKIEKFKLHVIMFVSSVSAHFLDFSRVSHLQES